MLLKTYSGIFGKHTVKLNTSMFPYSSAGMEVKLKSSNLQYTLNVTKRHDQINESSGERSGGVTELSRLRRRMKTH